MGRRDGLLQWGFGKRKWGLGVDSGNGEERRGEGRGRPSVATPVAISGDLFGFAPSRVVNEPLQTKGSAGKARE